MRILGALLAALALAGSAAAARVPVPRLDHVVVIVFENEDRTNVLGSGAAPTFDRLALAGANLTNYFALAHPSLPNYVALVSGSTHGIVTDCTSCVMRGETIGDELTRAHRAWGGYGEGYPSSSRFAKRHMPFLYFPRDVGHVHPLGALHASALPALAFVAPNLCDDMHDCTVATGDRWLARFVAPLLRVPRTAIFVVFDEGRDDEPGGGHVAAVAAGTAVAPHTVDAATLSHYSLLRTISLALGVRPLGAAARAPAITGIWR